jgi:threonine/homoserine/homoserine lactone efflux protein
VTIQLWLSFVVASSIMLVIPGPTILTVIAYATSHGQRATLPLVAAVALGDMTLITLSVVGLGSVMAISSNAFTVVKIVGGLYLLYLGLTMIKSAAYPRSESIDSLSPKNSKLFFNTWFVTALNPKGILFFGAFLPQFINTHSPIAPKLGLLSLSFVILAAINSPAYALLAAKANRLLRSRAAKRKFDFNGGVAISVAGIWAITARPGN